MTRRLKIDLAELVAAFDESPYSGAEYFLDTETGNIVLITEDLRAQYSAIAEAAYNEDGNPSIPFAEALDSTDNLDAWERETLLIIDQLEGGAGGRFIEVPHMETRDAYSDMEDFIKTVSDQRLQDRLSDAIAGRGAFARFRDVLLDAPDERERWFAFKDKSLRLLALRWLRATGIEPIE